METTEENIKIESVMEDGKHFILSESKDGPCHKINIDDISILLFKMNLQYRDEDVIEMLPECLRGPSE